MDDSKPVIAIISFRFLPGFRDMWLDVWMRLRCQAVTDPTCRQFRLLRDRNDEDHCALLSEWDRASDFEAFVREAGVIWHESVLDGTSEPMSFSVFESIPLETDTATQAETRELIPVELGGEAPSKRSC